MFMVTSVKEHHLGETELRDFLSSYTIVEVNRTFLVKNIIPLYQAVLEVEPNVNLCELGRVSTEVQVHFSLFCPFVVHSVTMVVRKLFADGGPLDAVHLVKRLFELVRTSCQGICKMFFKVLNVHH